jgi:hypothetical protein
MMRNKLLIMSSMLKVKTILFFIVAAIISGYSCKNSGSGKAALKIADADTAIISFTEYEHNFGKVTEGEKVSSTFTFENKGKGPLIISSVTTSCGCTVPKYETKPVPSGGTGLLEVVFDSSGRNGRQTKTITVNSNASKPIVLLRITGEVKSSTNN